ncbi:MAG: hypothetical protein M5U34_32435 [Chloroflexi bacterium]|nr:hypothetical protein [Chloroflexota bacterium]
MFLKVALNLFQAQDASILLVNEEPEITRFWHASDPTFPYEDAPYIKDVMVRGLANWVIENKQAHIVKNTQQDHRWVPHFPEHLTYTNPGRLCVRPSSSKTRSSARRPSSSRVKTSSKKTIWKF